MIRSIDNVLNGIKEIVRGVFPNLWVLIKGNKFLFSRNSYLNKSGYIESMKLARPCRADGSPLPWMNYAIIRFLQDRVSCRLRVFEYGTGSSTLFWAALTDRVVAIEHDPVWFKKLRSIAPQNVELMYCALDESESYPRAINYFGAEGFDIIIVDGEERSACLQIAPEKLTPSGVIIFDDSDRSCCREGVKFLTEAGFKQLKFVGLKPTGFGMDETSIFYRDHNCLGI